MNESCQALLKRIYEVSFAMDDILLYLDTHPDDRNALSYYQYVAGIRKEALAAYAAQCGPLLVDQVDSTNYWTWLDGKWPWEGGTN